MRIQRTVTMALVVVLSVGMAAAADRELGPVLGSQPAVRVKGPCYRPNPDVPCPEDGAPTVGGCSVFPSDNAWNRDVSTLPVHANSDRFVARINSQGGTRVHPDFGADPSYGIPYIVVQADQPTVPITYTAYGDESDPGPFPIPPNAPVEGGSDRHVLVVQQGTCGLFELFGAQRSGAGWSAESGARWNLRSNALRPLGWTSADAAGLPILPGLVRYDEVVEKQSLDHALRFTLKTTRRAYVPPASHWASEHDDGDLAPMGMRVRLKANFDLSGLSPEARVILTALKKYGMFLADNGSDNFISGAHDPRWNVDALRQINRVKSKDLEVVEMTGIVTGEPAR